ncbi:hypothetical protein UFOVP1367_24 [uncultured Caudovirales phage]|uniref:Uncharacterized protein n=1 Tax=uncultured Caudovirales phage TaxID=2100421 RepID=A0A6J5S3J1_9CAUD|nr:hypothetical protein KNT69_gp24 [uncultured Caudovirales phage]CAB4202572.1 hypothetical protein UFOVP1367_24 [uncultured Caudovirales phage]
MAIVDVIKAAIVQWCAVTLVLCCWCAVGVLLEKRYKPRSYWFFTVFVLLVLLLLTSQKKNNFLYRFIQASE